MKKVISFSLWGNEDKYTVGAIKNAQLAQHFYPDFECWFYIHQDTVPSVIINELQSMSNVKVILRSGDLKTLKPMLWRFESIDDSDVEINLSRDTDTRILMREKLAVDEWIQSGTLFHIMRDHPHHMNRCWPIMAGMFGTRKLPFIKSWIIKINNLILCDKYDDQTFLKHEIYHKILDNCMIHSSFGKLNDEQNVKKFPIPYDNQYNFVGGYVYADDSVSLQHTNILKSNIKSL